MGKKVSEVRATVSVAFIRHYSTRHMEREEGGRGEEERDCSCVRIISHGTRNKKGINRVSWWT